MGKDVPVRYLFDAPTVGRLAVCLDRQQADAVRPPLQVMPRPQTIPLSYAQQRLWFFDQLNGPSPVYNLAVGLRLTGDLDPVALGQALGDVVGRHESLRTMFTLAGEVPQQLVVSAENARMQWQVVDAVGWPADRLVEAASAVARHPFDLSAELPLKATLFRVAPDEHVLVAVVHHIAADGWSVTPWWRISAPRTPVGVLARCLIGHRCRCSTRITRCGNARIWVTWPIPTVGYPGSWRTGSRR